MKNKIRAMVLQQIKGQGFDIQHINSYSLNRKANGVYQMIIFFGKRKTSKGDKRFPDLPIGKDFETALAVVEIIEEEMLKNEEIDILKGISLIDKPQKGDSGW